MGTGTTSGSRRAFFSARMDRKPAWLLFAWLFAAASASAEQAAQATPTFSRPVHTYSIVARDPTTGEMGVAVQSHWFSVGPLVVWGEAGVGVVATQSFIDPSYGALGLALMRAGHSAEQALRALTAADMHPEVRQVAMLDAKNRIAAHTGKKCIPEAGHHLGEGFSVQANLMVERGVWPAMAAAFERAEGDLAGRMLTALEAAEARGGDLRGRQSAALLVVKGESSGQPWRDRVVDLRIEDHPEPLAELRRLLKLHRAYQHMNAGDAALEAGASDKAIRAYGAAQALAPGNLEMKFWHAVTLVNAGREEDALPMFGTIFAEEARWAELVPRLAAVGLLKADAATLERIQERVPAARNGGVKIP